MKEGKATEISCILSMSKYFNLIHLKSHFKLITLQK